jgi:ATP-dependent RNA helicase DeaD
MYKFKQIERINNSQFHKLDIPSGKDVCRKQFFSFMDKLLSADISHGDYETYVPMLAEKFADVSKEDVLKRVAAMEFDRFLKYYENSEDLNLRERTKRDANDREPRRRDDGANAVRLRRGDSRREYSPAVAAADRQPFVREPRNQRWFFQSKFLTVHPRYERPEKRMLGKIDMKDMNSWIEIDKGAAQQMIRPLDGKSYKGRRIRMNDADSGGPAGLIKKAAERRRLIN